MRSSGTDATLATELEAAARDAAPGLLKEALEEARAEAKEILKHHLVNVLLEEAVRSAASPAATREGSERPSSSSRGRARSGFSQDRRSQRGVYLYGFTFAGPAQLAGLEGIDGSAVYPLTEGDIVAVVSDVSAHEHSWGIGHDGEPDLDQLAPRLQQHEKVLEAVLDKASVVPMRFGTLYPSQQALRQVLAPNAASIWQVLHRLDGKVEWGLTVTWGVRRAEPPAVDGSEAVGESAHPFGESPGRAYLVRREAEVAESERLKQQRFNISSDLHRAIDRVAEASVVHPLAQRREGSDGTEILLRASYLVDKAKRETFEAAIVEGLEAGRDLGLSGELTGPWPPYNFAAVELQQVSA